jgi:hypothetical protein
MAIFILENQLESHLPQPLMAGRVPAPPAGAHADQPGEAAQRR